MGKKIKCVVWDLDNTIWDGILAEGGARALLPGVEQVIKTLDARGILQSVCSKNDEDAAMERLRSFGVDEYFLYPQISWGPKSAGVSEIRKKLNLALDAFAFVDDQAFERDEVKYELPGVECIDSLSTLSLPEMDMMKPDHLTEDSALRRQMYRTDQIRNQAEESFSGPKEEFLRELKMRFIVSPVGPNDLARAEELTIRTHQLNATGRTYSYEELEALTGDPNYDVLIAQLIDRYGDYGKIGLALIKKDPGVWTLKLLLMSCRVMSRGVGSVLLRWIKSKAREVGATLNAEFVRTDRNRAMFAAYRFEGFSQLESTGDFIVLRADLSKPPMLPDYIEIVEL